MLMVRQELSGIGIRIDKGAQTCVALVLFPEECAGTSCAQKQSGITQRQGHR